jgi:hypothetical protein
MLEKLSVSAGHGNQRAVADIKVGTRHRRDLRRERACGQHCRAGIAAPNRDPL